MDRKTNELDQLGGLMAADGDGYISETKRGRVEWNLQLTRRRSEAGEVETGVLAVVKYEGDTPERRCGRTRRHCA